MVTVRLTAGRRRDLSLFPLFSHSSPLALSSGSIYLNDLYLFSPTSNKWTTLSAPFPPSARGSLGFVATPDGMIYVFGGFGPVPYETYSGERRKGIVKNP